jgi:hypothetical protein
MTDNAQLREAAPEMVAVLQEVAGWLNTVYGTAFESMQDAVDLSRKIREALNRAGVK